MKKWLVANLLAAVGVFALIAVTVVYNVCVRTHRVHLAWAAGFILAAGFAFFCVANRGLWRSRGPVLRGLAIVLLSAALTVAAFIGSLVVVRVAGAFVELIPAFVSGRVVDAAGQPVAGARLKLYETQAEYPGQRTAEGQTDADGRFRLRTRAGYNGLDVRADGYASMNRHQYARIGPNRNWDFELVPALTVSGRVVDTAGRPVPDRFVGFSPMRLRRPAEGDSALFGYGLPSEPTDAEGRFTVAGLAPCMHQIEVRSKEGDFQQNPVNRRRLDLASGRAPESLELVVRPADDFAIAGRVTDAAGRPLEHVWVDTYIPSGSHWTDWTDKQGAFRLRGLDGIGTTTFSVGFNASGDWVLRNVPLNATNLHLTVPDVAPLRGAVRDARTGKAVKKFEVEVVRFRCPDSGAVREKSYYRPRYLPDGRFELHGVPAGVATFDVSAPGLGTQRFDVDMAAGAPTEATFEMKGPAVLEIDVAKDGVPTNVNLCAPGWKGGCTSNGHVRIDSGPNGKHRVWFFDGYNSSWQRSAEVELRSGETTRLAVDVGGSCEIRGKVVWPDEYASCEVRLASKPARDGWTTCHGLPNPEEGVIAYDHVSRSGADYRLGPVPAGRWYLMVGLDGRYVYRMTPIASREIELKDGETLELDFDLTESGALE